MASSDDLVRYVRETLSSDDLSEATSRGTGSNSFEPASGQQWSLRLGTVATRCLLDEPSDDEEVRGNEEEWSSLGDDKEVA
ncbi:UNVERIFIED_CONTAM: hypothetical protein Sangu_0392900 [Sesamum angustifolium]|uniref:Uncharacterized protein n=1 Tax=Sesamum angustifolium TaxID=2727405 RepID=A0AAW2QTH1_9LAMI